MPLGTAAEVEQAVQAARAALADWSETPAVVRARVMFRFRQLLNDRFEELAALVTDRNFRLFAERGLLHVINGQMSLTGTDPFALFQQMQEHEAIDPAHAFYLGYELAKAATEFIHAMTCFCKVHQRGTTKA